MPRLTETRALRAKLPAKNDRYEMCSEVKGAAVRLTAAGSRTYGIRKKLADGTRPFIGVGIVGVDPFEGPPATPGALDLIKIRTRGYS